MFLNDIYNYNHRLADHPVFVKSLYVAPAFLFLLFSESMLFKAFVLAGYFLLTLRIARISFGKLIKLYSIPVFFILTGCVTIALSADSSKPFISFQGYSLGFEHSGLLLAGEIFLNSTGIVSVVFFGLLTFSISDISIGMRFLRLPVIFVDLFILTYKFIFFLSRAANSMMIAQKSRLAYISSKSNIFHFSLLVSSVFRKAFKQTHALEIASNSRLSDDKFVFVKEKKNATKEKLIGPLALTICFTTLFVILEFYG